MDTDRVDNIGNTIARTPAETSGKVTGDIKLQAEDVAQSPAGKAENAVGGADYTVRDIVET